MFKKIDLYIVRTFLGPFLFIFSVLFFIFIVQFAWQELDKFMGKGLSLLEILRLLLYLGITVIQLVLPLTILLASIMTFGGFGETYELTALKASGISLFRIMMPVLMVVILMAIGLFYFSDKVIPSFQYKAKNMLNNIANTKPALSFEEGKFINDIPGYAMKINKIRGENNDIFTDIIVHRMAPLSENQQTIKAQNGTLQPTEEKNYLKFELYNGFIFENDRKGKTLEQQKKQPNSIVKYDTLVKLFDISELIDKELGKESINNNYKFFNYSQISEKLDTLYANYDKTHSDILQNEYTKNIPGAYLLDSIDIENDYYEPPIFFEDLDSIQKVEVASAAVNDLRRMQIESKPSVDLIKYNLGFANKVIMFQQNIVTYSFTCILFFLIGASLGSIIRKGGIGMPVVVAIIIFVCFFILYTLFYQSSKNDLLNPYWASWLPNLILLPLAIFLTIKAVNDSQLFDINKYSEPIRKIYLKFVPQSNKEHSRYQ